MLIGQPIGCWCEVSRGVPTFTPASVVGDRFEGDGDHSIICSLCLVVIDDLDFFEEEFFSKRDDLDSISISRKEKRPVGFAPTRHTISALPFVRQRHWISAGSTYKHVI